ncbi:Para-aminobenzoate synthase component 1 [Thalassovita autumnalis]|uniref:Para-aminobenzoate synthase component 1 n=1 Tax=Thalassovita autumnalis TaxID=2072972 RepID=A0A0P1F543_9RHOB|nr:aminodeoxychorismate synthase component I [Thalassovita autumnalis]CUH62921.1 Para-aminobenzoate synthase component 1 [Thalassovita autumnalis]CUH72154.1 Para-aminobenzoate synthase component 1 [Thalassovita autumnalis]
MQIRMDRGPEETPVWFRNASAVITAQEAGDVPTALAAVDAALAAGKWVAGYASYELGYALEPRLAPLMPEGRHLPLLSFGIYDTPVAAGPLPVGGGLQNLRPRWDAARYRRAFDAVHGFIGAGDIYQANLTFPIDARAEGGAEAIYGSLMAQQPVGYGALVLPDRGPAILSRSPELFFRTSVEGAIETRPMKGTQPRSADPVEDQRNRDFLATDEKNRAENLMIVDLLRNDISRVAEAGSVKVPELFKVESYATVHQMVSKVVAELRPGVTLSEIFTALFPCGSITGAPKLRSMQILRDLEPWPRDIYCGAIGWAAPDGRSEFNVAIRTVMLEGDAARLNVGGGVVWDSTATSEYEEALWKSRFARTRQVIPPSIPHVA